MAEAIKWILSDPWHYAWTISVPIFGMGLLIGRSGKTRKLEQDLMQKHRDLRAALRVIELKKSE